jgi:transcriptional regulator with XRE-family HTH domain
MIFENHLSDEAALAELGRRLARWRLDRNLTQKQLAGEAGVARITVARAEGGQSVTLSALVRILRALDLLENVEALVPEPLPSPIEQLEREGARRQRATGVHRAQADDDIGPWRWGTS